MSVDIKEKIKKLKIQIVAIYLVYIDKEVQWYKKGLILLILIYALSPIDLIPDFIPVLGLLDDVILIPLGIYIVIRAISKDTWHKCLRQADEGVVVERKLQYSRTCAYLPYLGSAAVLDHF